MSQESDEGSEAEEMEKKLRERALKSMKKRGEAASERSDSSKQKHRPIVTQWFKKHSYLILLINILFMLSVLQLYNRF